MATATSPTDFAGKTFDITFASGAPSGPWVKVGPRWYSVESLIGQTFSLTMATVSFPAYITDQIPAWTITDGDCYEDTRAAGTWGAGCKVGIVTDGLNVSILGSGSVDGGGPPASVYGCSWGVGGTATQRRIVGALCVQFDANWFDCFEVSGSTGTGPLAPFKTATSGLGDNVNTGWDSYWGSGGDLTIAVS
jgi:hypothetical protein